MEPILEKLKLDFDSDVPLEEQKKEGMNFLREHYRKLIEAAMSERAERVKHAREEYLKELEVDVVLSTADIRSRRFECDSPMCQHTACCIMSNTSFSCLDCCPKSFVSVAPVMHDEHREAILHSCTSIIDECVFDKHVPPPSLCQHFWCRQVVPAHLKEGSTQHLQYCSCKAIVCGDCFNYEGCVDNAIYDSDGVNLSLGDMMDIISNDDAREQILHAFDLGKIDKYMIMDIIKEYMQRNALADDEHVPFLCKPDSNKNFSKEKVAEVEKKITQGIARDKERILHSLSLVENEVS